MADRGQQARLQTKATQRDAALTRQKEEEEMGGKKDTLTLEQSHSAGEKLTYGARVIKHEELHSVSSQKTKGIMTGCERAELYW